VKITKRQLKRIIREEKTRLLAEGENPVSLLQIAYGDLEMVSENISGPMRSEVLDIMELVKDAILGLGGRV